jgi:hypothetical protein
MGEFCIKKLIVMELKDIQHFIDKEKEYISKHKNDKKDFEYGTGMIDADFNNPEYFLKSGKIQWYYNTMKENIGNEGNFELTEAERVVLRMFYGDMSHIFRDDYYQNDVPEIAQELFKVLNSVVSKAPQNKSSLLYRFCVREDNVDLKKGDVFTVPHNLTCTEENWNQSDRKHMYIIEPLKEGMTKAHNVYKIFEHGLEHQVNFTRKTSFEITKVIIQKNGLKKIYMKELP